MGIILYKTVYWFFTAIIWILIARILLSWLPNINWNNQPFKFIRTIAEPILTPFRLFIPPISGMDFSPIVAFLVLNLAEALLLNIIKGIFGI